MKVKQILILSFLISLLIITGCSNSELETEKIASFSITTEVAEGGEIRLEPKQDEYDYQEEVKITAIADEGWEFKSWSGNLSGTEKAQRVLIEKDKNIIAEFELIEKDDDDNDDDDGDNDNDDDNDDDDDDGDNDDDDDDEFSLEIKTAKGGEVEISPEQDSYQAGEKVELEAVADENWEFSHWREDSSSGSNKNPWQIEMESNRDIRPVFSKKEHTVTFQNYDEEILKKKQVEHGSSVQAPSVPKRDGYKFVGWDKQDFNQVKKDLIITAQYKAHISGQGTEDNPYQINTFSGLEKIGQGDYSLDKYYQLASDIDASITQEDDYNNGQGWDPIGDEDNNFAGSFDGLNYKINSLYINRSKEDYVGLFREIERGSEIKNIVIIDSIIKGENNVGGLVGSNSGNIINADFSGEITAQFRIGGITGFSSGEIKDSSFLGKIEGKNAIGGLVGGTRTATIINSNAEVDIKGEKSLGGLVGGSSGGSIKNSYAQGKVIGDSENIGGLIGSGSGFQQADFRIKNSYAEVNVKGSEQVGGLAGSCRYTRINNSYATGNVKANKVVGGLIGSNSSGFRGRGGSISNSYATGDVKGESKIGGLAGRNGGSYGGVIRDSYALGNVTGENEVGGLVGYNDNRGRVSRSYATGDITGKNKIGGLVGDNKGLRINESYATGDITGLEKIGGLVGYNDGLIEDSYSQAKVEGENKIGGLIGENNDGEALNSYNLGDVEGKSRTGGIVGANLFGGTINNSYSKGRVKGNDDRIGGIVGFSNGGSVNKSYWDVETSGQEDSAGGKGKTTAEMQSEATYQDWDFDDLWAIDEANSYPYLQWK